MLRWPGALRLLLLSFVAWYAVDDEALVFEAAIPGSHVSLSEGKEVNGISLTLDGAGKIFIYGRQDSLRQRLVWARRLVSGSELPLL